MIQPSSEISHVSAGTAAHIPCDCTEQVLLEQLTAMSELALASWIEHCTGRLIASDMQYLLVSNDRACWGMLLREAERERDRRLEGLCD